MSLRCIEAARHFRRALHLRFVIAGQPVGWVRTRDVPLLTRWPDVFEIGSDALVLSSAFETVDSRSAALGAVIGALAAQGCIPGWRNETYAIRNAFDDAPLALIERAASRFFGTMTFAVHVNGIVGPADAQQVSGAMPHFWIARRSDKKATDPGMLDNLVGGGIGWGLSIGETLVKECYEESGIDETLARTAVAGRVIHVLQEIDEGTQAEQLFVHDLLLPDDFAPLNTDGEVAEHRLVSARQLLDAIHVNQMTVDASLASLDCLLRRGWLDAAQCAGFDALLNAPDI